jgi:hypothetical protein
MRNFTRTHVFILPHVQEYRKFYDVTIDDVLDCLNTPDTHEGLATDHYTAEKAIKDHRIYVYYYLTYPVQAKDNEVYAIVDFIGYTTKEDLVPEHNSKRK